jgi:hypothetical protein
LHRQNIKPLSDALTLVASVAHAVATSPDGTSMDFAWSAINDARSITGQDSELYRDIKALEDGTQPERLAVAQLWSEDVIGPSWAVQGWAKLRSELDDLGVPCWRIWYEHVVTGSPRSRTWEEAFTDVPGPLPWEKGGEAVNAEIALRLKLIGYEESPDPQEESEVWNHATTDLDTTVPYPASVRGRPTVSNSIR